MFIKIKLILVFFILVSIQVLAQNNKDWNGKKCAVALTYDDALQIDIDNVMPVLDSLSLKATFYVSLNYPAFKNNPNAWKLAAAHGHELGSHSLFHPCLGNLPGRAWVSKDYDLANYSVQRMRDELKLTNVFLEQIDGKKDRTFAFPCGDTTINNVPYIDKKEFVAARGVSPEMKKIWQVNLYDIGCYMMDKRNGDYMINLVKEAIKNDALLVFLFHGVGGGHPINVSLEAHRELVYFLKQHEAEIWIAPLIDIAQYIKKYDAEKLNN